MIHDIPLKGSTLWGCEDVASVDTCQFVPLQYWTPNTKLDFFHISGDSSDQAGWLRVSTMGMGDFLLACYNPEDDAPYCKEVTHELRPPAMVQMERHWPEYETDDSSGGGGGLGFGGGKPQLTPETVIGKKSRSDMWLSTGIKMPGPINLYACRKLHSSQPECQLAIPDWYQLDRENLGLKKVSAQETPYEHEGREYVKVVVEKIDEEGAAAAAGLGEGTVIVALNGFRFHSAAHFKGLMAQFPATYSFELTLEDESTVTVEVREKPPKK